MERQDIKFIQVVLEDAKGKRTACQVISNTYEEAVKIVLDSNDFPNHKIVK